MDKIVGDYFVAGEKVFRSIEIDFLFQADTYRLYEVIRVKSQVALFLENHLARLFNSIQKLELFSHNFNISAQLVISQLLVANKYREGNIKLLCNPYENSFHLVSYYIPHNYPEAEDYSKGIKLLTNQIDRPEPNLKQVFVSDAIRNKLADDLRQAYEILLINKNGVITEGSKSNFFLVKGKVLFTAPDSMILKGITRQYVLQIAKENKIKVCFEKIKLSDLPEFDAAFICGTSPKILPVYCIDEFLFDINNRLIRFILDQYNRKIEIYIQARK
jgi:branched-chain amino acid aminotransferase